MSKQNQGKQNNQRTQVTDLPRPEKQLSQKEQKEIQGGATRAVTPGIRDNPKMANDVNPQ